MSFIRALRSLLLLLLLLFLLLILSLFLFLFLLNGYSRITDLSSQEPYSQAIGRRFVLQQNMYVYEFNDLGRPFRIGNRIPNPACIGIPEMIDERYIGTQGRYVTLRAVARRGSILTIKSVIKKETFENMTCKYYISLDHNSTIPATEQIDTYDITNIYHNPPDTKSWFDPPIFQATAALPLASDPVWWKHSQQ
jgi:hypothetical protein